MIRLRNDFTSLHKDWPAAKKQGGLKEAWENVSLCANTYASKRLRKEKQETLNENWISQASGFLLSFNI